MKKVLTIAAASLFALTLSAYTVQAVLNWVISAENAKVKFRLKAHGQELLGSISGAKGDISFDAAKPTEGSINCTVDIASIKTGIDKRDEHLQAKGWFDAAGSPVIRFASTKIEAAKEGYTTTGNITIKGVTKEISFPFTFVSGNDGGTFKGSFMVKRSDFGIGKTEGDIDDAVTIDLEIPVTAK